MKMDKARLARMRQECLEELQRAGLSHKTDPDDIETFAMAKTEAITERKRLSDTFGMRILREKARREIESKLSPDRSEISSIY